MQVKAFVDPACGWSQVTVTWLRQVQAAGAIRLELAPFSLLLRDGTEGRPPAQVARRTAGLRGLRVLTRLSERAEPAVVTDFWDALVAQDGPAPFTDLAAALETVGGDAALLAAADDEAVDEAISHSMAEVTTMAGTDGVTLPVLVLDGTVHFTGPLLRSAPRGAAAGALFDAVVTLARTPGFYELSRARPSHPELPGLPPPPAPPQL